MSWEDAENIKQYSCEREQKLCYSWARETGENAHSEEESDGTHANQSQLRKDAEESDSYLLRNSSQKLGSQSIHDSNVQSLPAAVRNYSSSLLLTTLDALIIDGRSKVVSMQGKIDC